MPVTSWKMMYCNWEPKGGGQPCDAAFGKGRLLAEHKRDVHGLGVKRRKLNRSQIIEATACPNWQEFTVMLKGLPVDRKLFYLHLYLDSYGSAWYFGMKPCCNASKAETQVLYAVNRLAQAGQIEHLPDLVTMDIRKYWDRIKVKK